MNKQDVYRTNLCRSKWADKDRPILINNWEATYFDFDIKNNRHNNRCNTGNPIAIDCYFSFCAGSLRGTGKV